MIQKYLPTSSKAALIGMCAAWACGAVAQNNRGVYFFHGHPGNPKSLQVAANYLSSESGTLTPGADRWNQLSRTVTLEFNSNAGVEFNARDMRSEVFLDGFRRANVVPTRSIALGSSYGGLVARRMIDDDMSPGIFEVVGGVITHGTPNEGSPIAENIDATVDWGFEAIGEIITAPALEAIEAIPIVSFFAGRRTIENALDRGVALGFEELEPLVGSQGTRDLEPDSPLLQALNDEPEDNVERILTYAEETAGDLVWRVMGGAPLTLLSDPFEANEDVGVAVANALETLYRQREALWDDRKDDSPWYGRIFNSTYYTINEMRRIRNAYRDGIRRFENMDGAYKNLAGFNVTRTTGQQSAGTCTCQGSNYTSTFPAATAADCQNATSGSGCDNSWWTPPRVNTERVYLPNDGIVPVESQRAFNTPWQISMPGDNHFTSNNSANFENALQIIFDGRSNPWFDSSTQ